MIELLRSLTTVIGGLSDVGRSGGVFARVVDRETQRSRERQALEGHHVGIPATGEEVDEVFVHIVLQVAHRVGDRHEVALVGHVLTVTKVEDLLTCGGVGA